VALAATNRTAVKGAPSKPAKAPLKKVADNSAPVIAQPTVAAESASTPEVVGV
jgi:hypothetical protein